MMIRTFIYFTILAFSVWLGLLIKQEPGYFLIVFHHWSIEMPFWFATFLIFFCFICLHYFLNTIEYIFSLKKQCLAWVKARQANESHSLTTRSILALTEGQWIQAEKLALKAVHHSDCPLIEYLIAARAAQHQGAIDRRDRFFRQAKKIAPQEIIAVELTQAQLQIESHQYEQALATVKHLHEVSPRHDFIIKLLYKLYKHFKDWQNLVELLPSMKKSGILQHKEFELIEQEIYYHFFLKKPFNDAESLDDFWQNLPKHFRKKTPFIQHYVKQLLHFSQHNAAEMHLKIALKKHFDNDLIRLYGKTISDNPTAQLALAEYWLQHVPNHPVLLATLARLSVACEYWGKARAYFDESLAQKMNPSVAADYAALLEKLGEIEQALHYYKASRLSSSE